MFRLRAVFCLTILLISFVALPLTLRADGITVYSNLGPGNSYDASNGYTQSGAYSFAGSALLQAMAFTNTTGQSILLGQIDIADSFISGNNSMTLSLYANNGGAPGTLLESWFVSNLPDFGTCCTLSTVFDSAGVVLQNGATYFLAAAPDDNSWDAWNFNLTGASGVGAISTDGGATWTAGTYNPTGAFDVIGRVPEPSTALLTGLGLAASILMGLLLGRQRGD